MENTVSIQGYVDIFVNWRNGLFPIPFFFII